MTNPVNMPSMAFGVERVRAKMLENLRVGPDLLQKAIDKVEKKLEAKTTKFFSFQGKVEDKVDVEDHAIQLAAAEKILGIAGVYAREKDGAPTPPMVAVEIDPQTGVVRLVIGALLETPPWLVATNDTSTLLPPAPTEPIATTGKYVEDAPSVQEEDSFEDLPQVIHVRKGNLPSAVFEALFGDA